VGLNPLVLIGVACVIAAIVGGGLKLTGIEIPLLTWVCLLSDDTPLALAVEP